MAAVLMLLIPASGRAQSSTGISVPVAVDVFSGLSLTVVQDLDFGLMGQNAGAVSVQATSPAAGKLHLLGQNSRRVDVTLSPPATLVPASGSGAGIPYTWGASFNENADDPASATAFGGLTQQVRPQDNFGPQQRRAYIYLYGTLDVGPIPPGIYEATFTVTATY